MIRRPRFRFSLAALIVTTLAAGPLVWLAVKPRPMTFDSLARPTEFQYGWPLDLGIQRYAAYASEDRADTIEAHSAMIGELSWPNLVTDVLIAAAVAVGMGVLCEVIVRRERRH